MILSKQSLLAPFLLFLFQAGMSQDTIWTRRFDSGLTDWSVGGSVDPFGDLVTVGEGRPDPESETCFVRIIKYNPDGEILWNRCYDSDAFADSPTNLTIDALGNIIIVGYYSYGDSGGGQILKYDRDGNLLWVRHIPTPNSYEYTILYGVVTDDSSCIVAAGECGYMTFPLKPDVLLVKYTPEGEPIWARIYDLGGEFRDYVNNLVLTREGSIVGTGTTGDDYWHGDFLIVKFSPDGDTIWSRTYDLYLFEGANGITSDAANNTYISGLVDANGIYRPVVIKLSSMGETLWTRVYEPSQDAYAFDIGLDSAGNVLVIGSIYDPPWGMGTSCFLMRYTPSGDFEWIKTYKLDTFTDGFKLSLSGTKVIYLMGTTEDSMCENPDMFVIKLSYSSGVESPTFFTTPETPPSFIIFTGEPLRLNIPHSGDYRFTLYDISGRCVSRIYQKRLEAGKQELPLDFNIPTGVYILRMESPNFSTTGKLIKVE